MSKAWIEQSPTGWILQNGLVRCELLRSVSGGLILASLRNERTGYEWAAAGRATGIFVELDGYPSLNDRDLPTLLLTNDDTRELALGGVELILSLMDVDRAMTMQLTLRCYPGVAVIEYAARLENHGSETLPPIARLDPLYLCLRQQGSDLRLSSIDPEGSHGFYDIGNPQSEHTFTDWTVLEDPIRAESLLVGGDLGAGVLQWQVHLQAVMAGTLLHAGAPALPAVRGVDPPVYELAPGLHVQTPISFLVLCAGDPDDVGNEAFRYLKRYVFPTPAQDSPLIAYCLWFTDDAAEALWQEEIAFARRLGFDVLYHDAAWYAGSSLVPGMNDWAQGLGCYEESREKFPNGLAALSRTVQEAGMAFGIWVDPGMVDSYRVASGEIPSRWLACVDGQPLQSAHPSLSLMSQLCLGDPEVVTWIKANLSTIIRSWKLEWLKWDPSGTINHACTRTDHGHGQRDGAYAAYRGKMEIWAYLTTEFPRLSGFECEPSLHFSRTNPGPRTLLPGGYSNVFVTGPMISPHVWGSLASRRSSEVAGSDKDMLGRWYSASALDYHLRKHFMSGISVGNINGSAAQRMSQAPAGYIDAFKRAVYHFKGYRHLLTEDVYHPRLVDPVGWTAVQYIQEDAAEAVLFVFRHKGGNGENKVILRGLTPQATYRLTSLNTRPGREREMSGAELLHDGLAITLPDQWLTRGDGLPDEVYGDQLLYGSDILMLRRL